MYFNIRLKAGIFYGTILIGIVFTVFIFVFSPKGFGNLDSKKELLEKRKEKIAELNRQKIRLTNNIEYILSYATTFGYLDSSKNEKIIKIIKDEEVKNISVSTVQKYSSNKEININVKRIIILSFAVLVIFFIICFNKQKYSSNQNQNINNG